MRDPLALSVLCIGTAVMGYGFFLIAQAQVAGVGALFWEIALVVGGMVSASVGGYAVGRSVAEDGAWDRPPQ